MQDQLIAKIAALITMEALDTMAKKAGVSPVEIMAVIAADPEGNTARYFKELFKAGIAAVPSIISTETIH